jgi:hypothetical protein
VADGDYYARNSTPKWRQVGNTLLGSQDVRVTAGLATQAYAEMMRLGNGAPGLNGLAVAFAGAARDGDRDRWMATVEQARREHRHHANTENVVLAAQALLENDDGRLRNMSYERLATTLAEAATRRIAQQQFEKCRLGREAQDGASLADLQGRQQAAIGAMDLPGLAQEMLRHEDGRGFKAPARQTAAVGTEGLIGRTLVGPS